MPKILYFITQSEFGGAQRYVFDLANNLKSEFKIIVAFGEQSESGKLTAVLKQAGIEYYILPHLQRSISPISDFLALLEIVKLIKEIKPDIIHLNSSKISILGSLAAFIIKLRVASCELRVVYTVHGWVFNEPLPTFLKWFYFWAEKFTARFKNKIICVSEYDRQVALKYNIAPTEKLITIHNGINNCHSGLEPESRANLHEQISGLRVKPAMTGNLLIGSIGNLYKTKGFEYFIEAAKIIEQNQNSKIKFIIIGEGSERSHLEKLIKKYSLKNNFILAGQIDQAARLLPALDIYVCSSVKEGLSYTLIEAMQAGRPIVATRAGGNPELIEDGLTGLISPAQNAKALAEKIKTLLNNKTLALKLGQNGKAKALAEFGLEKMVEATRKIYSE